MAKNLCEAFAKRASTRPNQIAIQWKKDAHWVRISYGELQNNIRSLSSALSGYYGIRHGDRAAILIGNRPEWPIVFFALLNAGAIPVPLNTQGSPEEAENILKGSGCIIAFTESSAPAVSIRSVSADSQEFKQALYMFPGRSWNTVTKRDDDACIMYTSGTTSSPKGVVLSHGNLLANMHSLYRLGLMKSGDGVVSAMPLYHTYSMVVTTLTPLVYGGRVIYPGSIRSKEVIAAIRESKAALFVGVPLVFEMFHRTVMDSLNKLPAIARFFIWAMAELLYAIREKTGLNPARRFFDIIHRPLGGCMRAYMSGGTKLKEDVERGMFKFGFTVLNGYGLTETSPVLAVNPFKRPKIGSVGLPIANVELEIRDKDEKGVGEIFVRGPNIMKGYYKNEELTRRVIKDGWLKTGDIGYMDEDGYLFLAGRDDDTLALGTGLKVYPDEIEDAYLGGAPLKEICVFDIPSPKKTKDTQALWAVVVPDMDYFETKGIADPYQPVKAALEAVSRSLSVHERLMGFSLTLDALPRTILGKTKRREVKRRYLSGEIKEAFRAPEKKLTNADLEAAQSFEGKKIIEFLEKQIGLSGISPSDSFEFDLGIDMLGRVELAFELEKALGLKMTEEEMNGVFTVRDLIERFLKSKPR